MEGKKKYVLFFTFWDLNETFIFMSKLPTNEVWIGCPKKGRAHLVISYPKNTKSLKENLLLIDQSSSYKTDSKRKLPTFWLFETNRSVGAYPPKKCVSIFADSESGEYCGDFGTWVGRWWKWNGGVTIFSKKCHANVVITGKISYPIRPLKS